MARYKIYKTARALGEAVEDYFATISRKETVMEPHDTGKLDKYGHKVFKMVPAKNGRGEEIQRIVYLVPPTVGGLCEHIGVSNSTWSRYCSEELHPKFAEVTEWAMDRIKNWISAELVVRPDKMTKGILRELEANHHVTEKRAVEITVLGGDLKGLEESELQKIAASLARRSDGGNHA